MDTECVLANVAARAIGVALTRIGAASVHAEVFAACAVIACDAFGVGARGADASAAVFIGAAVVVFGAAIATECIYAGAVVAAVSVVFTRGSGRVDAGVVFADFIL